MILKNEILWHVADPFSRRTLERARILAEHADLTGRGEERPGEHANERRLPRTAWSDKSKQRTLRDRHRHAIDGDHVAERTEYVLYMDRIGHRLSNSPERLTRHTTCRR